MLCQDATDYNVSLSISAAYLADYVMPPTPYVNETFTGASNGGLSQGGIAGIVIGSVVGAVFLVGLLVSLKGTQWVRNICKNKTQNLQEESPRFGQSDLERKETGLAGSADIAHNPSNQVSI